MKKTKKMMTSVKKKPAKKKAGAKTATVKRRGY